MLHRAIQAGSTSVSINVPLWVQATGAAQTGLVYNSSGLKAYYTFTGTDATATSITLATLAAVNSAYSSGGFVELSSTNQPGLYRLDLPNAALASGKGRSVTVTISGFSGMATQHITIPLMGWNDQATEIYADVKKWLSVAVATPNVNGVPIIDNVYYRGTAYPAPATAGVPDINVKNMNNVSASAITTIKAVQGLTTADTIATYTGNTPQTGDSYARIGDAGVGLTNLGDTRIANLDTTVSSRLASASYTEPDNASIADILADTNELQTNQGNWLTATGFSTHSASDVVTALDDGSSLTALATTTGLSTATGAILSSIGVTDVKVDAIKAQTDKLQFNASDEVAANTESINDSPVQGDGSSGNKWRGL